MLHISPCVSSRQTNWDLPHVSISFLSKVMGKSYTIPTYFDLMTSHCVINFFEIRRKIFEIWSNVTTRHFWSKIGQTSRVCGRRSVRFLSITFDRKEIETWGRCQTVCLDETHWLICNMTYLGRFRDLTWGQISKLTFRGHVMIKIGHVAYVSMRLAERDSVIPFPRLKVHFLKVTLQKTCNFPMTQSKPRLLLRTTQTTDYHQPHLDISTQPGDINRKRSQRHLHMPLCR